MTRPLDELAEKRGGFTPRTKVTKIKPAKFICGQTASIRVCECGHDVKEHILCPFRVRWECLYINCDCKNYRVAEKEGKKMKEIWEGVGMASLIVLGFAGTFSLTSVALDLSKKNKGLKEDVFNVWRVAALFLATAFLVGALLSAYLFLATVWRHCSQDGLYLPQGNYTIVCDKGNSDSKGSLPDDGWIPTTMPVTATRTLTKDEAERYERDGHL